MTRVHMYMLSSGAAAVFEIRRWPTCACACVDRCERCMMSRSGAEDGPSNDSSSANLLQRYPYLTIFEESRPSLSDNANKLTMIDIIGRSDERSSFELREKTRHPRFFSGFSIAHKTGHTTHTAHQHQHSAD